MNKSFKLYTLISASVFLALGVIMVYQTKETVMPIVSTDKIDYTISFNKANCTSTYEDGVYTNITRATFSGGREIRIRNKSTSALSEYGIARINNDGLNHRILFEDDNWGGSASYIQNITSFDMTFVEGANNGTLNITCWRDQNAADYYRHIDVIDGVLQSSWPIDEYRGYSIETTGNTMEVASITIGYSCQPDYEDPINPANQKTMTVMVSNDFHGYVEEEHILDDPGTPENEETWRLGLKKFGTYFKNRVKEDNTLWLDQGDSWQGSIYSNMNKGALINNVMAYAGCTARTVGNHDFDWGVDAVKENTARIFEDDEHNEYTVPTLAANIYRYDFESKQFALDNEDKEIQESEIGAKTKICVLGNGLKVGIIGVIGEDQITSINSLYTQDIGFKPHIPIIEEEADNLRNAGCNIVICSIHADQDAVKGKGLENYVDLVLCGHSHQQEDSVENGLKYLQFGRNGECFGEVRITYSTVLDDVWSVSYQPHFAQDLQNEVTVIDPVINKLVNEEMEECDNEGGDVLATGITGTFSTNEEGPNLVARAIYDYATTVDHITGLDFVYVNNSRSELYAGNWTYADVYQAFPFDNLVYVTEITGKEVYDELRSFNLIYTNPNYGNNSIEINANSTYKVAVLDYLLYHNNSSRYYDYFPIAASRSNPSTTTKLSVNYREIMRWWLETNEYALPGNTFSSSDFESTQVRHSKSKLSYNYYQTGELHCNNVNLFTIGSTSTTATASLISNPETQVSLTINHGTIMNQDYGEFQIASYGEIDISKDSYHIVGLEVKTYQVYDNINFFTHNDLNDEETKLDEYKTVGNKYTIYNLITNDEHIIIKLDKGRSVQFYYINVLLMPNP